MDLNPVGRHCALQSCNVLDFLPIQCTCLEWFCKLHVSPDLHDCSTVRRHSSKESSSPTRVSAVCALSGCNKHSILTGASVTDPPDEEEAVQIGCPGCQLSFCVHHRHMQSHSCTGLTTGKADTKHEIARGILAQKFLASTPASHTPVVVRQRRNLPSDPQRLAQLHKVNLMKLRHKAVPADPKDKGSTIAVDQRLYAVVRLEIAGQQAKESALWFRKTTVAGKALDLAVQHFTVSHTVPPFYLSAKAGGQALQNHLELSGQIADGSTIVLSNLTSNE